jgi:Domain of unknown function (DUF2357)
MPEPSFTRNDAAVMRRFVGLLMSPAPTVRFEKLLPPELYHAARSTYFLLDTSRDYDAENFITYVLSRLVQRLNRDTRQTTVTYQGRIRGRVVWPATIKAHYGQDYDPSRYVCREVRRKFDTPENRLLKHLLERLSECLKAVPQVVRSGICCYSLDGELRDFADSSAYRFERMERAIDSYLRHVALADVSSLQAVTEWHLLQAETARIDEYVEVARFFRRYQTVVSGKRWSTTFEIGKRMLPLPGWLDSDGDQWLRFALSIFRTNTAKEFQTMDKKFHFNGIDGSTGAPLLRPMGANELMEWIKVGDENEEDSVKNNLRTTREQKTKAKLGPIEEVNPFVLNEARWGVIYPVGLSQTVKDALQPLVKARAGVEFTYNPDGKPGGESAASFRKRFKQTPGKVDPKELPYYLLIVASAEQIPFKFQYGLDADHAVGRLYFDDENDYAKYVSRLLAYEGMAKPSRRRLVCTFAPENADDDATALSASALAKPLAAKLNQKELEISPGKAVKYDVEELTGAAATKKGLTALLERQDKQPALIFTASHGLAFPSGDKRQADEQGALVCQEWPGPEQWPEGTPIPDEMFFAGDHVPKNEQLDGLIFFSFACYSAGTPRMDDFSYFLKKKPKEISPQPFISKLPQKLLAQGALAFIGHVERAWDYSFVFSGVGANTSVFESTLEAILKGKPIGHALEHFNDRYLALAREITESEEDGMLHQFNLGEPIDPVELASLWFAHNDARAYVLFGDPFARLKPELMDSI